MNTLERNVKLIKQLTSLDESARLPDSILKLKKVLSKEHINLMLKEFSKNPSGDLIGFLRKNTPTFKAHYAENYIRKLAENGTTGQYGGQGIDAFSAFMISRVMDKLTTEQKVKLLSRPIGEVTAIAYKLANRTEF